VETELRERTARWGEFEWSDFEEMFEERLDAEGFGGATVLDVGTGEGRLAFHLAPRADRVIGIDVDEGALSRGRARAAELELDNVTFVAADADAADYRKIAGRPLDFVVANHFMSDATVAAAAVALRSGGRFVFACHHRDHWIESGRVGRFSYDEAAMERRLAASGLRVEFLGVERLVVTYANMDELAAAHPELHVKFMGDGRWLALKGRYLSGPVRLTWATVVGVAAKP
jgi:SAM-dependent methyltransferase